MTKTFEHVFTEFIPDHLENYKIYISLTYNTAVHRCACGCGEEVVTPLSPKDWKLTYNGESISLHPSIGNWSFQCRSHYWVKEGRIVWAETWSDEKINAVRAEEHNHKKKKNTGISNFIKKWFK